MAAVTLIVLRRMRKAHSLAEFCAVRLLTFMEMFPLADIIVHHIAIERGAG